ncbi:hypothetical protein VitviT2T_024337 [Vitis vinifera]|uniref:Uncharacterized protein n=1 Tax=Vitis vinifera TaxID=29760 RepID=A0ABY9DG88_VITVI|nr:hypothetical protein VitviT2T_024337 [Vitis vinifera]
MSARVMATHEAPRVEMPKPHTFSGKRDAKELDNFLWHMKRYFEALVLTNEATKETHVSWSDDDPLKCMYGTKFDGVHVMLLQNNDAAHSPH